jgi:hypothetical protein
MRIHIELFDESDLLIAEGNCNLSPTTNTKSVKRPSPQNVQKQKPKVDVDFSLPERAFFKRHGASLSGPKQFVLVLAYLAKGKAGSEVALSDVKARWGKMTSILRNGFNPSFTNTAKEQGWVDVKKQGMYVLHSTWIEIFQ